MLTSLFDVTADDATFGLDDVGVDVVVFLEHVLFTFALKTRLSGCQIPTCTLMGVNRKFSREGHNFQAKKKLLAFLHKKFKNGNFCILGQN